MALLIVFQSRFEIRLVRIQVRLWLLSFSLNRCTRRHCHLRRRLDRLLHFCTNPDRLLINWLRLRYITGCHIRLTAADVVLHLELLPKLAARYVIEHLAFFAHLIDQLLSLLDLLVDASLIVLDLLRGGEQLKLLGYVE